MLPLFVVQFRIVKSRSLAVRFSFVKIRVEFSKKMTALQLRPIRLAANFLGGEIAVFGHGNRKAGGSGGSLARGSFQSAIGVGHVPTPMQPRSFAGVRAPIQVSAPVSIRLEVQAPSRASLACHVRTARSPLGLVEGRVTGPFP